MLNELDFVETNPSFDNNKYEWIWVRNYLLLAYTFRLGFKGLIPELSNSPDSEEENLCKNCINY